MAVKLYLDQTPKSRNFPNFESKITRIASAYGGVSKGREVAQRLN